MSLSVQQSPACKSFPSLAELLLLPPGFVLNADDEAKLTVCCPTQKRYTAKETFSTALNDAFEDNGAQQRHRADLTTDAE